MPLPVVPVAAEPPNAGSPPPPGTLDVNIDALNGFAAIPPPVSCGRNPTPKVDVEFVAVDPALPRAEKLGTPVGCEFKNGNWGIGLEFVAPENDVLVEGDEGNELWKGRPLVVCLSAFPPEDSSA